MLATRLFAAALIGLATTTAAAQATARVAVAPESKLWIDGTSNLHAWSCRAEKLDAIVELDKGAALAVAPPSALKRVEVKVPVKSLKCNHAGMDGNVYKALNADGSPEISYILATFEVVPGAAAGKDSFTLTTAGALTINGTENKLAMDVTAIRLPDGTVKATGTVPIKMTDYGIKPPTAIFGRLKTGDDVTVNFELTVGAKAIATALGQP